MSKLSNLIKEHRKASGLSQNELANLAGVGKTLIFDLEHEKQSVRLDKLQAILKVLNIDIEFKAMGKLL